MAKLRVRAHRDDNLRTKQVEIWKGRKKVTVDYEYSPVGDTFGFSLEGRRDLLPSVPELLQIVDAKRLDRIGTIELIDLITEITNIKNIESIDLIDKISEITNIKRIGYISPAVSVGNRGQLINSDFEESYEVVGENTKFQGWLDPLNVATKSSLSAFGGFRCITLKKGLWTFNGIFQFFSPPIPTNDIDVFSVMVYSMTSGTLKVKLFYTDGTTTTQNITVDEFDPWTKKDLTYTANKHISSIRIYTEDDAFADWDKLAIDSLALIYKITGRVKGIETADGLNILIDKLKQDAYTERRSTLSNDNGVTTPTAPPSAKTGTIGHGKFFPRGCRGFIRNLQIYCKRTGAGTVTLAVSPIIGMGEIYTVEITPDADWNWKSAELKKFWNYDSLFIWVKTIDADVSIGYDAVTPYDYWYSGDLVTWNEDDMRLFVRVSMPAETVGDIPVSGTLNTIKIPSASSVVAPGTFEVDTATVTEVVNAEGSGKLLFLYVRFHFEENVPTTIVEITVDGGNPHIFDYWSNLYQEPPVKVAQNGDTATWFLITLPYEFKRSFRVRVYHAEGNTKNVTVRVVLNMVN